MAAYIIKRTFIENGPNATAPKAIPFIDASGARSGVQLGEIMAKRGLS